ncbi:MAG: molybdenum transporter permease subunit [Clostridia bacterium]|nr:molybdenum transporter permease subunit [Clostridia bacterium]
MNQDMAPFIISLKTTGVATAIAFVLGIYGARLVIACDKRWRGLIDGVFTLPMVLPPTVVGFFLLLIFGKNSLVGKFLLSMGIQVIFSWSATVIAATVVAFPLMYRTVRGAFEQMDQNIVLAARTLGMSERKIFWKITVPLSWPGIIAGTVLAFARALGEFGATLMIAGGIPGKTQTMPLAIFFAAESGDMEKALIWVLLLIAVSFTSILLLNYWNQIQAGFKAGRRVR